METNLTQLFPEMTFETSPPPNPLERLYSPREITELTQVSGDQIARLSDRNIILPTGYAPGNRPRYDCAKVFLFWVWYFVRSGDVDKHRLLSYWKAAALIKRVAKLMAPYRGRLAECTLLVEANAGRRTPKILLIEQGIIKIEENDASWWMIHLHIVVETIAEWYKSHPENKSID